GPQSQVDGPWAAGSHSALVRADDAAGNLATTTITFRADARPEPAHSPSPLTLGPVLALFTIVLACAGGLLYGLARPGRAAANEGRKPTRKDSTSWHRSFAGPDDHTDSLLCRGE